VSVLFNAKKPLGAFLFCTHVGLNFESKKLTPQKQDFFQNEKKGRNQNEKA